MHLMAPANIYLFWMKFHPSKTFPPKELKREPQNRLPLSPHHQISTILAKYRYVVREPFVHAPLPYESIVFLTLTCLPLPSSLSNPTTRSGFCLTLAAWMSSWVFILCITFLLRDGHCLGVRFLFFNSAHVPFLFFVRELASAPATPLHCSCYGIIHPFFVLLLLLGLQAITPAMPISHNIPSLGLHYLAFLLG